MTTVVQTLHSLTNPVSGKPIIRDSRVLYAFVVCWTNGHNHSLRKTRRAAEQQYAKHGGVIVAIEGAVESVVTKAAPAKPTSAEYMPPAKPPTPQPTEPPD